MTLFENEFLCVMCDCKNPPLDCDGCGCGICDTSECCYKKDGYILCQMCAYDKKKSTQDK